MAFFMFLVFASVFFTSEAQQKQSSISRGTSLKASSNSSWLSSSGVYAFGFFKAGSGYVAGIFIAGIPQNTRVWGANQDYLVNYNATLIFTSEGKLVLQSYKGQYYIGGSLIEASLASMLDSGNFVLYDSNGGILWQSFDHPTNTLLPTQRLRARKELVSTYFSYSRGKFRLKMKENGNLVQFPVRTPDTSQYAYYESGTSGKNISLNGTTRIEWKSSDDNCDPKGLCGFNGFCVLKDGEADCRCVPGFKVVDEGNWSSGCERNFSADSSTTEKSLYRMEELPNTTWENNSYSVLFLPDKIDCKQACFDDHICEAAFYKDGSCSKQRLPLRYGRRLLSDANIVFVKVFTFAHSAGIIVPEETKRNRRMDILIITVVLVTIGSILFVISLVLFRKSKFWAYRRIGRNNYDAELSEEFAPRSYTHEEIEKITDGFKEEIGRGSFGTVYKGTIMNSQKVVAVKKLGKPNPGPTKAIGRTNHRNLVRLLGYCNEGAHRVLVYEYMSNGSLADILFKSESLPCWVERLGIACGIARGILYLHEECESQIIHCDIKPQNVLIDENRRPKISDFGLAKLLKPDQTRTFTRIRGTRGYVAPEWHKKLPITVKADVYSFGIVLLEIICCRRNVIWNLPEEEAILDDWVYNCFEAGELHKLRGNEEIDMGELERIVKVALWCIQEEPTLRPSVKKVLLMLEGTVDIPTPHGRSASLSRV
ncbi:hypothetical protein UlMin_037924 [Ulmus minor]